MNATGCSPALSTAAAILGLVGVVAAPGRVRAEAPQAPQNLLIEQPKYPSVQMLSQSPANQGLVIVTHGWQSEANSSDDWVLRMANAIDSQAGDGWDVGYINWEDRASTASPLDAVENARSVGLKIGRDLGTLDTFSGYERIQIIGHSAGSWLIDEAVRGVELNNPAVTTQTTFLDAFVPYRSGKATLGSASDWSEQYIDSRVENTSIPGVPEWAGFTSISLDSSQNIDVSNLDPVLVVGTLGSHRWPIEWYLDSVHPLGGEGADYLHYALGYHTSIVHGEPDYPDGLAPGDNLVLNPDDPFGEQVEDTADKLRDALKETAEAVVDDVVETVDRVQKRIRNIRIPRPNSGGIGFDPLPVFPATLNESEPLVMRQIVIDEPFNLLEFDYEFGSDPGAEGLMSVFLGEELILAGIDERFAPDGVNTTFAFLGRDFEPGEYWLSFRLDSFSDVASRVEISNGRFSQVAVPLPSTFALVGAALVIQAVRRPRRRKARWQGPLRGPK